MAHAPKASFGALNESFAERSARLRATSQYLHEKAVRRRTALEWADEATTAVRGTATSDDGVVRATVDHTGMLVDLELAPNVVRGTSTGELAELITSIAQRATADARHQVRGIYQGLVDEGTIRQLPQDVLPAPDGDRPNRSSGKTPESNEKRQSWLSDDW